MTQRKVAAQPPRSKRQSHVPKAGVTSPTTRDAARSHRASDQLQTVGEAAGPVVRESGRGEADDLVLSWVLALGAPLIADDLTSTFAREVRMAPNRTVLEHYAGLGDPWFRAIAAVHQLTTPATRVRLMRDDVQPVSRLARAAAGVRDDSSGAPFDSVDDDRLPSPGGGVSRMPSVGRTVETPVRSVARQRVLTDEQRAIMEHPPDRTALVQAFAGTGKTSTLVTYAETWPREAALYLAFNSAIAREAQARFPSHVDARTGHSLAFRAMRVGSHRDRLVKNLRRRDLGAALRAVGVDRPRYDQIRNLRRTLRRFLIGHDTRPQVPGALSHLPDGDAEAIVAAVDAILRFEDSDLPFTHDVYLKRMALAGYVPSGVTYVMVDEAQDLNPVMIGWLRQTKLPLIIVGDPWQSIYAFRGAVSAMDAIDAPTYPLTLSWRFGPDLATLADRLLRHVSRPPRHPVRGHPDRATRIVNSGSAPGQRRLVLARSNAGAFDSILWSAEPFYVEGGFDAFAAPLRAATRLRYGGDLIDHAEGFEYASWDELVAEAADGNADAARLVALVEQFGRELPTLLEDLKRRSVPRAQALIRISTAHRAKGLEADEVEMLDDFPTLASLRLDVRRSAVAPRPDDVVARDQEIHLLYVAATRAKAVLYAPDWIMSERS